MSNIVIDISNESSANIDAENLRAGIAAVIENAQLQEATIHVAVVDNEQILALNRKYLQHDYATDVLSFRLSDDDCALEGDVIVSQEMAAFKSKEINAAEWTTACELLLYVIHGTLHLVGYDDKNDASRQQMQREERAVLEKLGLLHEAAFKGREPSEQQDHSEEGGLRS